MRRKTAAAAIAAGMVIALGLTACGSNKPSSNSSGGGGGNATPAYKAAIDKVFNPSTKKGGTLRFAHSGEFDSTDGADTYYGYSWDFIRLYGRALTMFAPKPGKDGNKLVPDLAESLGQPSADAKTWTYKLKSGVKFEDGTPVTSQDVKYAVERTFDRAVLPNGPSYFASLLAGNAAHYPGPFKNRSKNLMGLTSVTTPNPTTIVFQLNQPFA